MSIQTQLPFGRIGENKIALWLVSRGNSLLPVYEIETDDRNKGPRVTTYNGELIAPDLLVWCPKNNAVRWVEAKRKTRFTWYRKKNTWQTGIDLRCYQDYLQLATTSPFTLWLLFLHEETTPSPDDLDWLSPSGCPTGLYGGEILQLEKCKDHCYPSSGWKRMVYWNESDLKKLATLEEVNAAAVGRKPIVKVMPAASAEGFGL